MFKKLLEILPSDNVPLGQTAVETVPSQWPLELRRFWEECGAGFFGGLAFHVLGVGFERSFQDIEVWNREAMSSYRWLVPEPLTAFAEDAFGTQFMFDPTDVSHPVLGLVIQDGTVLELAPSLAAFFDDLLNAEKRDAILNESFYIECLTNDVSHEPGCHLTLRIPRCLGGHEGMGLIDVDSFTNIAFLGQLLEQAQHLPPEELRKRIRFSPV